MTPESAAIASPPPPAGMSEISRIAGVFFEPAKTFEDVAARPSFLVPLVLVILTALAVNFEIGQRLGWERVVQQQMEMSKFAQERMAQAPADQQEASRQMQLKLAPMRGYAGAVVGLPIGYLIFAAILLGMVRIMSAPIGFKQVFAVVCYAAIPSIVQDGLKIVVLLIKNPEDFNMLNPLAFNPAAFMDYMSGSKFLYGLGMSLDVFRIWNVLLIAVGLKAAAGKSLSFGGALLAVGLPWVIFALLGATMMKVFG